MKRIITRIILLCAPVAMSACSSMANINKERLVGAAGNAAIALTISDSYVAQLSAETVAYMDANNTIAPANSEYTARLNRLTKNVKPVNGQTLKFKVYMTNEINAFACGDGSIRVYSGLMDAMTDDEVVAIIGHEIGHVANTDTKDAMKNAYLAQAALGVIGSTGNVAAQLTDSQLGGLALAYIDAQYSQKQEFAADDYGFQFCIDQGFSKYGMASSLERLNSLSGGAKASTVQKWFSSHPDSGERAERVRKKADAMK